MKKFKLLFILILLFLTLCGCAKGEANDKNFRKIKVGMTPNEVHALMGKPDDTENEEYFEFQYWFDGASSMKDAQEKFEKGRAIRYYCIIFFAEDKMTYKIEAKEDIVTGIWGRY